MSRWTEDGPNHGWRVLGLAVGLFLLYLMVASGSSLWDRDEPRFARAAVQMLESGDYLVPRFNGELRPDKPVFIYWLMTVSLRLLGVTEVGVRLWSAVGMTLAAGFTYLCGRRLFDAGTGWWSMAMFGTSLLAVWIGSAATADGVLMAAITGAHWLILLAALNGPKRWHFYALGLALGIAQLTKGPVGLAVPLLTAAGMAWFGRGSLRVDRRYWLGLLIASVIGVAMFLGWALPADASTGGRFAAQGLGKHVFQRMAEPMEGHGGVGWLGYLAALPAYVPLMIFGFFPWMLLFPGALSGLFRQHVGEAHQRAVLWGWVLPTFILMSLVATKLPHYILPIYPAAAIASAATLRAWQRGELSDRDRDWLRGGAFFVGGVGLPLAVTLVVAPLMLGEWVLSLAGSLTALALVAFTAVVIGMHLRERARQTAVISLLAGPALMALAVWQVLPWVEQRVKISPDLAALVRPYVIAGASVTWRGYEEPSLVFYLNLPADRRVDRLRGGAAGLRRWAHGTGPGVLIIEAEPWQKLRQKTGPLGLEKLGEAETLNYSSEGKRQRVLVFGRNVDA